MLPMAMRAPLSQTEAHHPSGASATSQQCLMWRGSGSVCSVEQHARVRAPCSVGSLGLLNEYTIFTVCSWIVQEATRQRCRA